MREIRLLDPCMGSGHFLVFAFLILVRLRMEEENLSAAEACAAVLRDNLFGLELDARCTQIAAFNLALAAWKVGGYQTLPSLNLACSGLAPNVKKEDWLKIVDAASSRTQEDRQKRQDATATLERLEASATFPPVNYFRPEEPVAKLSGNLPHWRQAGTTYFVTFRCADALPQEKLRQWQQELEQWLADHPEPHDEPTRQEFYERFPKRIQAWLDAGYGECVLRAPVMREIVESAMRHFDGQRYRLQDFVVAANHVHALVTPLGEHRLSDILHSWKSFTANRINQARGKSGTFWQKESFDHIVRSPASLAKFREYIRAHPEYAVEGLEGSSTVAAASSRTQQEEERLEAAATMKLKAGMERLYQLFQKAPVLGSLINPRALGGDLLVAEFHELQPLLEQALKVEEASSLSKHEKDSLEGSATLHELAVTAQGVAKAGEILASQFTLVATNVPYLGRGKQDDVLKDYCARVHPNAKADLATCFIERCLGFCVRGGSTALVTPQNWWFLGSYKGVRENLLTQCTFNFIVTLGEEAWQSFGDRGPVAALMIAQCIAPVRGHAMAGLDALPKRTIAEKANEMHEGAVRLLTQTGQYGNPDHRIIVDDPITGPLLQACADSFQGVSPADFPHYGRSFWEVSVGQDWKFWQSTVEETTAYGGRSLVLWWNADLLQAVETGQAFVRGEKAWGKWGVACRQMRNLSCTLYTGEVFDTNAAVIVPTQQSQLPALWAFCSCPEFRETIRRIDKKVNVTNASFVKVPFDLEHWQNVAAEKYPHGLPKPFSSDPTQWLFNGHPKGATVAAASSRRESLEGSATLHVAVARLLGYRWPRQTGSSFADCPALGADGLEAFADDDGIVCVPSVRGEEPAAERLRKLLAAALRVAAASSRTGEERLEASATFSELELIRATGSNAGDFDEWLRNDFFQQHCEIFHHRPFIWHVWDGRKRDGFHALVNYHKLCGSGFQPLNSEAGSEAGSLSHAYWLKEEFVHPGQKVLASLTHSYLGEWIVRQKDGVKRGEEGAGERLAAAEALKERLEAIFVGESPYDLFVRWKPLRHQAIGWTPDINDGVRMNIRPFATADILRKRVKIKWEKDRGHDPKRDKADFPWFWKDGVFTGERVNDVHLTTEQKRLASEGLRKGVA